MVSTVTAYTDMAPQPRVVIDVDGADLNVATVTVTVWQISSVGQFKVRDGIRRGAVGGTVITDYEVPLGIPVSYRVEQFNTGGTSLGFVLDLSTQVDLEVGFAVFSDPLNPKHAVLVAMSPTFGGNVTRKRPTRVVRAGVNTVALMGLQGLLADVPLHCETDTIADADMLEQVLAETQCVVRIMAGTARVPSMFNVVVPEPSELPISVQYGGELITWDLVGQEVSRTEVDIIVPVLNYQRFKDFFNTYGEAAATYSTYLDALRNPPPEA